MLNSSFWKKSNLILIVLILVTFISLVIKIMFDSKQMTSPFLPKYTVFHSNGSKINVMCFLLGGLIPAVFLRIKRKYVFSTLCILLFFLVGWFLKDSLKIYEHFYGLSNYF